MLSTIKQAVKRRAVCRVYYDLLERVHRMKTHDVDAHGINPFRMYEIDPARINRFSGRPRGGKSDFRCFGRVLDGDWDRVVATTRQSDSELIALRSSTSASNALAEHFEDTLLYASLKQRFVDGVAWEDTPFIGEMLRTAPHRNWPSYATPVAIERKCASLDRIFTEMRNGGFRTTRQTLVENGTLRDFLDVMENEILVDVARDGELLFFDGKHRLAMARILNLPRIRVAVVVRHPASLREEFTLTADRPAPAPLAVRSGMTAWRSAKSGLRHLGRACSSTGRRSRET
jgi:hypothetical protein